MSEVGREWPATSDAVAVDPTSGSTTSGLDVDDFNLAVKLTNLGIAAHLGCCSASQTS
ncbi:hypothetical protein [Paenarthrobacter sp. NPDC018779]|uniref:hypothetical protein n=1 Tax=Paenarthrobacter sp. NPDC018779 TaxID=3364375 RepID=UPI0037C98415